MKRFTFVYSLNASGLHGRPRESRRDTLIPHSYGHIRYVVLQTERNVNIYNHVQSSFVDINIMNRGTI